MLKKTLVTIGVAAIVAVSSPLAATAATYVTSGYCGGGDSAYANGRIVTVDSPLVSPGQTVTVTWSSGYFMPGASVTVSAGGNGGSAPTVTIGSASGAGSVTGTADGVGGLVARILIPGDASGRVDITATSGEACGGVAVTVITNTTPAGGVLGENTGTTAIASSPSSTTSSAANLASTGGSLPAVLLASGGAAVVFGAILIGARTRARRHLHQ